MEIDEPDVIEQVEEEKEEEEEQQQPEEDVLAAALDVDGLFESFAAHPPPPPAEEEEDAYNVFEDIQISRPLTSFCCTLVKRTGCCNGAYDSPAMSLLANYCIHHGSKPTLAMDKLALTILYIQNKYKDTAFIARQVVEDRFDQDVYNALSKRLATAPKRVADPWLVILQDKEGKLRAWSAGKCVSYIVLEAIINVGVDSEPGLKTNAMALARGRAENANSGMVFANTVQKEIVELYAAIKKMIC